MAQHYSKKCYPLDGFIAEFDGEDHDDAPDHEAPDLDLMEKAQCSKRLFCFQETPEAVAFTEDQIGRHGIMSPNTLHRVAGKVMKGFDPMIDIFRRKNGRKRPATKGKATVFSS
jgi:hypothetical protein